MDREESFVSVKNGVPHVGSDDEEDSFVVLETTTFDENSSTHTSLKEDALPPLRTNKVHEMQKEIKMNISQPMPELPAAVDAIDAVGSSAKIVITPDSSYEEIQKQVEDLIKENETLKNIIAQNNISMKNQYERFVVYKDEVTKVMKSYKDKLNEGKNCIDKLKEENAKLVSDVEVYINIKKLHEEEIINLKEKIRELELSNCIDGNSLGADVAAKIKEFQTELAESNLKNKELTDENHKLTNKLVSASKLEEELQKSLQELKTELENRETLLKSKDSEIVTLKQDFQHLNFTETNLKTQIDKLQSEIDKNYNPKLEEARETIQRLSSTETNLQTQIEHLKSQLSTLQEKYNPRLEEDYIQAHSQLSSAQKTITALEVERETKCKEIEELRKLLQESNAKSDDMFALKEQVELFKTDFEAERESKETLKREKDKIASDLQNIQTRNKQLQNEVERLRAIISGEQARADGYTCPKCSFAFNNYQSLENHVHRCLDLDGFP